MKKHPLSFTAPIAIMLLSCGSSEQNINGQSAATADTIASVSAAQSAASPLATSADNSRTSLDWPGVYKGTLPCADCNGIETIITLSKDNTYTRKLVYNGKSDQPVFDKGSFNWDSMGSDIRIRAQDGSIQLYKVGENVLFHLDKDGNRITGDNAGKYLLKKNLTDPRIEGKKWILTELMGQPIVHDRSPKYAFIQLTPENGTFAGNTSCNNVFGSYELKEDGRISFGKTGSTMMACKDMVNEKTFIEVLQRADNYSVTDSGLSLNKARMAPLARFMLSNDK